jgi:tetratricopeptide (TPR) repeat protein
VAVNRATARALEGRRDEAEQELSRYIDARGATGNNARYNLGTVLGEEKKYDQALDMLRRALERNPGDEDARWNYEWLKQRKEQEKNPNQQQPRPQPQKQPQQQQPQNSQPQNSQPQNTPPQNPGGGQQKPQGGSSPQQMSREQADQLLGALQELARADQQRQRKVRVLRERHGKDW